MKERVEIAKDSQPGSAIVGLVAVICVGVLVAAIRGMTLDVDRGSQGPSEGGVRWGYTITEGFLGTSFKITLWHDGRFVGTVTPPSGWRYRETEKVRWYKQGCRLVLQIGYYVKDSAPIGDSIGVYHDFCDKETRLFGVPGPPMSKHPQPQAIEDFQAFVAKKEPMR